MALTTLGLRETRRPPRSANQPQTRSGTVLIFRKAPSIRRLEARAEECYFWGTHGGAELDLLIVRGRRRLGFEFKRAVAPQVSRSMREALENLRLERLDVVDAGDETFPLGDRIRAVAVSRITKDNALGVLSGRGRPRP